MIPGFSNSSATVDGVRLHYWLGGDPRGAPVLLWHGFLSTSYAWRLVAPKLAAAGLRVLIPDMRGFGDSDKPGGTDGYDTRALAQEFRALVADIRFGNGRPLTLVAHDMGAPPALIWAADYPAEIATLVYVEGPVMLSEVLSKTIAYTPEAMKHGSLWWWILPLAPGVPEALIVGNERAFLMWFYAGSAVINRGPFTQDVVDEYLRTFSGEQNVLAAMGVYRAAFTSIAQTTPLLQAKVRVPIVAIGGAAGLGAIVGEAVSLVAETVQSVLVSDCGHFIPEERPAEVVRHVLAAVARTETSSPPQNYFSVKTLGNFAMNDSENKSASTIPADDLNRELTLVGLDGDAKLKHVALAGDIYTLLLEGKDTAGKFCLIDMQIPPGGGPAPHRHDFEETFSVLEGEVVVTFRGKKVTVHAGETANVPANAPHFIHNDSDKLAHVMCTCAPAGQDAFFLAVGTPVPSRTSKPPVLSDDEKAAFGKKAKALAAQYATELL